MDSIEIKENDENEKILLRKKLNKCRIGVLIFAVIHFLYEVISHGIPPAAMFNYMISMFILKSNIKESVENQITRGIRISCIVFIVRLTLGALYLMLFINKK